jgi:hypothetical protein
MRPFSYHCTDYYCHATHNILFFIPQLKRYGTTIRQQKRQSIIEIVYPAVS